MVANSLSIILCCRQWNVADYSHNRHKMCQFLWQAGIWTKVALVHRRMDASLGLDELIMSPMGKELIDWYIFAVIVTALPLPCQMCEMRVIERGAKGSRRIIREKQVSLPWHLWCESIQLNMHFCMRYIYSAVLCSVRVSYMFQTLIWQHEYADIWN